MTPTMMFDAMDEALEAFYDLNYRDEPELWLPVAWASALARDGVITGYIGSTAPMCRVVVSDLVDNVKVHPVGIDDLIGRNITKLVIERKGY
jgi:hypothetical protein